MKQSYLYLALVFVLIVSCGGDSDGGEMPPEENTSPSVPSQIYPLNNTICIVEVNLGKKKITLCKQFGRHLGTSEQKVLVCRTCSNEVYQL